MRRFAQRRARQVGRLTVGKNERMALQTLRKGASGWIAKIFLVVLSFSFLIWGIADVFRGFGETTVATVGKTEISAQAFRSQYLDQIQRLGRQTGRGITPEQARAFGLDRQVLGQMVADAALDEEARRLDLAVSDAQVAKEIQENPNYRRPGASAFEPAYFDQLLRANNLTEARFVAAEKQRAVRQLVAEAYGAGIAVPQALLDAVQRYEGETRDVSYILVSPESIGPLPAPTEEQLRAVYDAHKLTFRAPEFRKILVLPLTPETVAAAIAVTDEEARDAYAREAERFGIPERREIRQMVFPSAAEAEAASAKIKAGASFDDIASARGLTAKDTDLGLVARAALVDPKIAEAAFTLPEGTVSAPVDGRFGPVLITVTRVEPGSRRPFEEVKGELVSELSLERARRAMHDHHDKVEDERGGGATLAEVAQKLGFPLKTFDAVDRSGRDPAGKLVDIPGGGPVVAGAFAADPGIETDVVQLPQNGGYVWYETAAVIPARERTFEEARAAVEARWREEETAKAIEARAKAFYEQAAGGKPLAEVAGGADLPIRLAEGLRRGRSGEPFGPGGLEQIFNARLDGLGIAEAAPAPARAVFKVNRIVLPAEPIPPGAGEQLSRQMSNDVLVQYIDALQKQIGVKVNERALAKAVGVTN